MDLGNNIHVVKGWPWAGNVYIINEKPLTLIDTGLPYKLYGIEKELERLGKSVNEIELILHTHGHIDHMGNTLYMQEDSNAVIYGHKLDQSYFETAHNYRGLKKLCGMIESSTGRFLCINPPFIDHYLFGDEEFNILGGLKVINTPGHTPGSVCFYSEKHGILFSGDTLQQRKGRIIRVHRTIFSEDSEKEEQSVQNILELDFDKLYSGHHHLIMKDASKILNSFN